MNVNISNEFNFFEIHGGMKRIASPIARQTALSSLTELINSLGHARANVLLSFMTVDHCFTYKLSMISTILEWYMTKQE